MTMKEERRRRRRRRRRRKKTILGFGGGRRTLGHFFNRNIIEISSEISLCPPFLYAIGSARNQKNLLKANGPFFICVKILIASATRFAAFRAEKEERERKKRARLLIFFAERERESLFVAPSIVSQRRDLNRMII